MSRDPYPTIADAFQLNDMITEGYAQAVWVTMPDDRPMLALSTCVSPGLTKEGTSVLIVRTHSKRVMEWFHSLGSEGLYDVEIHRRPESRRPDLYTRDHIELTFKDCWFWGHVPRIASRAGGPTEHMIALRYSQIEIPGDEVSDAQT